MDGRVAEEVRHFLTDFLERRRRDCADMDAEFTETVVDRLTRFTLDGGKRLRPLFAWWGWRAAGGADQGPAAGAMLRAAAALELIQTCALVHDDVMDGSALRRGNPAVHVLFGAVHRDGGWFGDPERYGTALAMLTGDLSLAWADDMLEEAGLSPAARTRARGPWRAMRTEMMAGQFLDIHGQARRDDSEITALRADRLKTAAYSVERPLQFGAVIAGAGEGVVAALRGYGEDIGIAFQLRDDLLGVFGAPEATGKPVGDDLREGKRTLLLAIGMRRARERGDAAALAELSAAVGDPGLTGADIETTRALLDRLGARQEVEERIRRLAEQGQQRLKQAPISEAAVRALRRLAVRATERDR
ncbi:geranylgeranyl diphosphate synthase type I [Spinactinospora alkalitolerans]|uniref:Geranylgeranyl diphosphate synthase type I n=1 Tax=Spinactinospora alkalitolerans TaxID=687207 RepID=A0A852TVC6_9ACTN|nr:polyprenyl synthetase family protein [Spinactinospora alkalitolerans]NYE47247.1 geranylgeranyl diphosphate synthase type I [Spinactinospora alkalitolerans]